VNLTDIDNWDTAALDSLVAELNGRFTSLTDATTMLGKVAATPGWKGDGSTAARATFTSVSDSMNDEAAALGAASELARQTSAAVKELKSALGVLRDDAAAAEMVVHPPPAVFDLSLHDTSHTDREQRAAIRQQLLVRAQALIVQAEDIDHDTAVVLRKITNGEIPYPEFGSPADAFEAGKASATLSAPTWPDMDKKSAEEINAWWRALPDAQKKQLIDEHPEMIGNLNGVDSSSRNQANRAMLTEEIDRVQTEYNDLNRQYIGAPGQYGLATHVEAKKKELDNLTALQRTLDEQHRASPEDQGGNPFLLVFEPDGEETKAAVAVGDPDKSQHVSVTVPGVNTTVGSMQGMVKEAGALRRETLGILDSSDRAGETVSTIAWIGYDPPDVNGGAPWQAIGDGKAKDGAGDLADFTASLGLTSDYSQAEQHLVLNGHSYGSTTASLALQEDPNHVVDDTVFYGSPGVYANATATLGLEHGHAYLMNDPDDTWINFAATEGFHGPNPFNSDFIQLSTEERTTEDNVHRDGVDTHSQYARPQENQGTPGTDENPLRISGYNLAAILADRPDLAETTK
jgi:hypothetical protein